MASSADFLPASQRVLYAQNPLVEVICQVRFPTILKIASEAPSEFQEKIRHQFPLFETAGNPLEGKIPEEILRGLSGTIRKHYKFRTDDEATTISLSENSLAIATANYVCWEDFSKSIKLAVDHFFDVYSPSFYSRIGLRYRNLIQRSRINVTNNWGDLLIPEIAAEFSIAGWADKIHEAQKSVLCSINDDGDLMRLQHGLAQISDSDEDSYLLDFDYYYEDRTETEDVAAIIERLHGHSGRAFRWAITETLHNALGPKPG